MFCNCFRAKTIILIEKEVTEMGGMTLLSPFLILFALLPLTRASLAAQTVKHLPSVRETRVQSWVWEDPLEKEMAPHSSTLAWKIPWTEEPGRLQSTWSQRVGHN